jgi:hypothetical protein
MQMRTYVSLVLFCGFLLTFAGAQSQPSSAQGPTSQAEALTLANAAYAALAGSIQVTDGTLTGNATWAHGSDQYTGTATVHFRGTGESRIDLPLGSFQRTEVWNDVASVIPDGNQSIRMVRLHTLSHIIAGFLQIGFRQFL